VGKSNISGVLGAQVRNEIISMVESRAAALSIAKGRYAALVFEWWAAQNFPAVTKADQAMQDIHALERFKAAEDKPTKKRAS
jgi:hypothetical protein